MQLGEQVAQEIEHQLGIDVLVRMQSEIELHALTTRRHAQRADDRHLLVRAAPLIEQWGTSSRLPAVTHQRRHQRSAFVEKYEAGFHPRGFF